MRTFQPDEIANQLEGIEVPFADVVRYLDSRNIGAQVRNTWYCSYYALAKTNKPEILIPSNKNRMGFLVFNYEPISGTRNQFSFGPPIPYKDPLSANNHWLGISIPTTSSVFPNNFFPLSNNGTVSIDDIYIIWDPLSFGPGTKNSAIIGVEQLLAPEGYYNAMAA